MKLFLLFLSLIMLAHHHCMGQENNEPGLPKGSVQLKLNAIVGGNILFHAQRNLNKKRSIYLRAGGHFRDLFLTDIVNYSRHRNSNGILSGIGHRYYVDDQGFFVGNELQANFFWFSRENYEDKDYGWDQRETYDIFYTEHGDYQTVSLLFNTGFDNRRVVPFVISFGVGPRLMRIHGRNAERQQGYDKIVHPHRVVSFIKQTWDLTLSLGIPL